MKLTHIRLVNLALTGWLVAAGSLARADCQVDANLVEMQARIARLHFPSLVSRLPRILRCEAHDFAGGALGDFNDGSWTVRVLNGQHGLTEQVIVWHELGHARASLDGETYGPFKGHGPIWLRVMIRSGLASEARRTAEYYPGLLPLYQQVMHLERRVTPERTDIDLLGFLRERPAFLEFLTKRID
ncbi:MAG: hypothetical protein QFF03_09765 [Pseudomonadota bacterium]|nr:hypothetical protein [Pseudomonadota bacterium]